MRRSRSVLVMSVLGILVMGLATMASAQQVDNPSDQAAAVRVAGKWSGTWKAVAGRQGPADAVLTQSRSNLAGTVTVRNTPCGTLVVSVRGTVSGSLVDVKGPFTCEDRRQQLRFQGWVYQNVFIGGGFYVYQGRTVDDGGSFYMNKL